MRAERAHVQPDRCRTRAAVEGKCQRTLGSVLAIERVSDEKHFGFDLAVATLDRKPSGRRRVLQQLSVDGDLVMRHHRRHFGHVEVLFLVLFLVFFRRGFASRRLLFRRCIRLDGRFRRLLGRLGDRLLLIGGFRLIGLLSVGD